MFRRCALYPGGNVEIRVRFTRIPAFGDWEVTTSRSSISQSSRSTSSRALKMCYIATGHQSSSEAARQAEAMAKELLELVQPILLSTGRMTVPRHRKLQVAGRPAMK